MRHLDETAARAIEVAFACTSAERYAREPKTASRHFVRGR